MPENADKLNSLYQRYLRFAIASLFLMALLQGLHSFFLTLFFWVAAGFGALALNYFIAAKREAQPNMSWQGDRPQPSSIQNKKNIFIVLVSVVIGFAFLFSIIGSLFSSKSGDEQTQSEQSSENSGQQSETEPTAYQLAYKEYDNQNYRQSISMCRIALRNDSNNLDFILLLGNNYGSLKQYDSSYLWFNKAYELGARSAYLSHWMGYFYDQKGETSRAIEFYKDALKQDSSRTQIYDRLAELEPNYANWYKSKSAQWKSN